MMSRKILPLINYFLYLFTIIFFVDYAFYFVYKNKIIPKDFIERRSSSLEFKVGYVQHDKKSSFINFEENKKTGIIRIGCFGDSSTHGDEVSDIFDYPSLLQDIFNKAGYKNIEVINFGIAILPNYNFDRNNRIIEFEETNGFFEDIFLNKTSSFTILLNNTSILSGNMIKDAKGKIKLTCIDSQILIMRADGKEMLYVEELTPEGIVYLSLSEDGQKESIKIPIAEWLKTTEKVFFTGRKIISSNWQ